MENTTGTVLKTARKAKGMVLRQVGEQVGVSAQAVGNWEADANDITMDNLRKVAALYGIDAEAASRGQLVYLDDEERSEAVRITSPTRAPALGPKDIELLGVTVGGDDADFTFNGEVIDYVRRPPGIATTQGVFANQVIGISMIPRFEPGEVIYAGGKQPVNGEYVIIELFPVGDEKNGKCFIKKLVSRKPNEIVCEQFNPPKQLTFNPYEIKKMSRVIPWQELLGY
ncbi:XRE family transcriptional regulator [Devosia ginsengisoli]|uniref:XRE family transcriptional regulator n=1 Tax=Devosia ginsengisoli TaxID=400770 RepID=UPI0026ED44BA|nr:XRE family transcriptional regulator [Devosia ginsengisoli]MCR6672167.1 helix-turn-helix domain-containing protein [Devosia ginsengisoli]